MQPKELGVILISNVSLLQLALLDKYEEILLKATAAAEDRKLTGSTKYKVWVVLTGLFISLSLLYGILFVCRLLV